MFAAVCDCVSWLAVSRSLRLKCDGTRAETRFRLSAKRTGPFKSAGESVQSTTGSRGVRISGSNAGYTMFRGSVKSTGYPLHSPVSPSLPPPVRHRIPSHFNWTLTLCNTEYCTCSQAFIGARCGWRFIGGDCTYTYNDMYPRVLFSVSFEPAISGFP